ncbi:2OG-Fe(II) oxygenase [Hymenobacter bucti]|uniref:2OG-Fe(II) oxygenase n=2 Tax=Hymenobacter bucti TaxID=1844114 RepID=A0ABW4QVP3_9BACT
MSTVLQSVVPATTSTLNAPPPSGLAEAMQVDCVTIRGTSLCLDELVDLSFFTPEARQRLRAQLSAAVPFPHLVVEGLFNPDLLNLVLEEFDTHRAAGWQDVQSSYERTRRSVPGAAIGPASQLYFDLVNSGWFTTWLSDVSGAPHLIPDPLRHGGGLHESRTGGSFAIHRDFDRHPKTGLKNEMVFITYLNRGWQPEWGSALELWDAKEGRCVTTVQPEFGRTLLMPHGPASFHGHPTPLKAADDRPRRSVAAYFYTGTPLLEQDLDRAISVFIAPRRIHSAKATLRRWMPPILWSLMKKTTQH